VRSEWDLKSATGAFERGEGQDWIERYLQVEAWQNLGLLRRARAYSTCWLPTQLVEIAKLSRISGPLASFRFPKDPVEWNRAVQAVVATRPSPESLPPAIAWRELDGQTTLSDGNHRVDALTELGFTSCWVLLHDGPLRGQEELARRQPSVET
jgi:hypothetical protein